MKQTAVEWFEEQVGHNSLMGLKEFNDIFEQAKEMEKEQIIDFAENYEMWESESYPRKTFEQYYNETYGK
jgi:hypothetical protein